MQADTQDHEAGTQPDSHEHPDERAQPPLVYGVLEEVEDTEEQQRYANAGKPPLTVAGRDADLAWGSVPGLRTVSSFRLGRARLAARLCSERPRSRARFSSASTHHGQSVGHGLDELLDPLHSRLEVGYAVAERTISTHDTSR